MYFNTMETSGPTHQRKKLEEIQPMGTTANDQDVLANGMGSLATKK